ncbi:hypothetical protein [Amylibacter sp. SFDW26]|uniref:hypothetical protein n=1 Tax=Amylibacter sp. SFDW26 TaxID=2652722 RepID=UPI001869D108|nr:hypothetical protein [Amylibacter sp. SFDW26]
MKYTKQKPVWLIEINLTDLQPEGVSISPNGAETFQIMKNVGYEVYDASQVRATFHGVK